MTDDSRKLVGEDKLREWLEAQGFRCSYFWYPPGNDCNWHAYRRSAIDARQCERNSDHHGMQIVVRPTSMLANGQQYRSAEIDLYGEAGSVCWRMSAYSIHPDQVPELLPDIEAALIRAWNALPPSFELADETRRLRGERKVLHDILRSCADVIEAIDPESEDERERIGALIETVGNALLGNNHST